MRRRADQISKRIPAPGERTRPTPAGPGRPAPRPLPPPRPARPPRAQSPPRPRGTKTSDVFAETRRRAPTTKITRTNYQPVILAEFIAAVLLVAATPIATKKNPSGLSPYTGDDMIKLAALTVTYLILALLSVNPSAGRFAAWFGGLILLTVGLGEAASLATTLDVFGLGTSSSSSKKPASAGGGAGGTKGKT